MYSRFDEFLCSVDCRDSWEAVVIVDMIEYYELAPKFKKLGVGLSLSLSPEEGEVISTTPT